MRNNRLGWEDYNMLLAVAASLRSPDPNTQVGAYICTTMNRPLSNGYNGLPRGIEPDSISWAREHEDPLQTKYPFIAHAEKNAILNSTTSVTGAKLYVTLHPCHGCAIDVIQSGITEVIYLNNPYKDQWQTRAADRMLREAGIKVRQHTWDLRLMTINVQDLIVKIFGG